MKPIEKVTLLFTVFILKTFFMTVCTLILTKTSDVLLFTLKILHEEVNNSIKEEKCEEKEPERHLYIKPHLVNNGNIYNYREYCGYKSDQNTASGYLNLNEIWREYQRLKIKVEKDNKSEPKKVKRESKTYNNNTKEESVTKEESSKIVRNIFKWPSDVKSVEDKRNVIVNTELNDDMKNRLECLGIYKRHCFPEEPLRDHASRKGYLLNQTDFLKTNSK